MQSCTPKVRTRRRTVAPRPDHRSACRDHSASGIPAISLRRPRSTSRRLVERSSGINVICGPTIPLVTPFRTSEPSAISDAARPQRTHRACWGPGKGLPSQLGAWSRTGLPATSAVALSLSQVVTNTINAAKYAGDPIDEHDHAVARSRCGIARDR